MTKKTRYSILAIGFVFFLIAAPLIVLYVKGIDYDFVSKSFVQTGILAVRTNPSDAAVYLNGKEKRQSQGDLAFLLPGSYALSLKKTGYFDWTKRLPVDAGQVTWASPAFNSIYLFLKNPPQQNLAAGVLDFYRQDKNFVYLNKDSLITSSLTNTSTIQSYPLPKDADTILTQDAAGRTFALTNSAAASSSPVLLIFNQDAGKFYDISAMFSVLPKVEFGDNGELYALSNNVLYSVDPVAKTKTVLFSGIKTFYPQGGSLYFVQKNDETNSLFVSQAPFKSNQQLLTGLPEFAQGNLFVTFEKEIFLLADGQVYSVNSNMQQSANNVSGFTFDSNSSYLSIIHSGEFDYYDPSSGNLNFITRSSQPLSDPQVVSAINNAFFLQGNSLMVIELDARGGQNQYQLYQGSNVKKFFVDGTGQNILLLDNGELKSLIIR